MSASSRETPRRLQLIEFRPLTKGALRGFASIHLPLGVTISDCPVLVSGGKAWVSLPSKPQLNGDGTPRRDANGKVLYVPILRWSERDLANRFSDTVVALVRERYPDALDGKDAP
jgi:hypothetical protein